MYLQLVVTIPEGFDPEILIAYLGEAGFESFSVGEDGLSAYIQASEFDEEAMNFILQEQLGNWSLSWHILEVQNENWNAVWESNFQAVTIAGKCYVMAPFHKPDPSAEYTILIEPKMSFGTAHHETTAMMIELLLDEPPKGLKVLDMGCGTGILAILSEMSGATEVLAIDNDPWAYDNTIENIRRNNCSLITAMEGDAALLSNRNFDLILANINRNILLKDMATYAACLPPGGKLWMSGFYLDDLGVITETAVKYKLQRDRSIEKNNWVAVTFIKTN